MVADNSEGVDTHKHKRARGLKRERELKVMVLVLAGLLAGCGDDDDEDGCCDKEDSTRRLPDFFLPWSPLPACFRRLRSRQFTTAQATAARW